MSMTKMGKALWMVVPPRDGDDEAAEEAAAKTAEAEAAKATAFTPEMQAAIQKRIDDEVAGLKAKNLELIEKQKALKENMSQYDGIDIKKIQTLQKQIEENEEMKLLSEGKTEEVVERRVQAMRKDYEANLSSRDAKLSEYETTLKQKQEELTALVVDGDIRQAYARLDFEPTAMDDVITLGRSIFKMDETGKAIPRDAHGNIIFSKDGKTPIGASEWLENLSETKKYLRRGSQGAGASGSGRGSSGGAIDTSKMTNTQRIAYGLQNGGLDK